MSWSGRSLLVSRRSLLAAGLFCAAPAAPALAAGPSRWTAYEAKLTARLGDAGGGAFEPQFERDLLGEINAFRRRHRLAALRWDEGLSACARAHAADMARGNYFDHHSPEGFTHVHRAALLARDLCGELSENLAWRSHDAERSTPRQMEELWENSPGHRENLLDPHATHAGYGVVRLGGAYHAVGVYSDARVRLSRPLPLRQRAGGTLALALAGALPRIERLALMAPEQEPTGLAPPLSETPLLRPGVWRLRPMVSGGSGTFRVLNGPMIFVA